MNKTAENQSRSVQDSVYTALRAGIINLNLAPGTIISEKEISSRFKVSRTPVREAFIHLSNEGLLRVIPQRETQVSLVDFARVTQEFFLRESLETAVLEPFINRCGKALFNELERLIEMQSLALEKNALIEFIEYDDRFHRMFFEVGEELLSWEVLERMSGHYHRVRLLTVRIKGVADNIPDQHRKILAALRKKDLPKARALLGNHLHKLDTEEPMLRKEFPGYFAVPPTENPFEVDFGGLPRLA
ncbi:MAG: GntR family transcriptional regulator [Treponema sp.]|jgi:DNA-binding GntR family transcriptional regulator|nr:GntR family transcriptional regulator [Treponema sp.]